MGSAPAFTSDQAPSPAFRHTPWPSTAARSTGRFEIRRCATARTRPPAAPLRPARTQRRPSGPELVKTSPAAFTSGEPTPTERVRPPASASRDNANPLPPRGRATTLAPPFMELNSPQSAAAANTSFGELGSTATAWTIVTAMPRTIGYQVEPESELPHTPERPAIRSRDRRHAPLGGGRVSTAICDAE